MPDTAEYLKRIGELARKNDPIELRRQTPAVLAELIAGASEEQLKTRPNPNRWSVAEILAHLAEDEIATAWRYRRMLEHKGIALAGFDQDLWARAGNYAAGNPENRWSFSGYFARSTCNFWNN